MERALWYVFVLSLVLVGLAYYVGLKSDATSLTAAFQQIIYAVTGRTSQGGFAGYPAAA